MVTVALVVASLQEGPRGVMSCIVSVRIEPGLACVAITLLRMVCDF